MNDDTNLLPENSPSNLGKPGVRRVNNLPIILLVCVIVLFIIVMMTVAFQRSENQREFFGTSEVKTVGDSSSFAKDVIGSYKTGFLISEANASSGDVYSDNKIKKRAIDRSEHELTNEQPNESANKSLSLNTQNQDILMPIEPYQNELKNNERERIQIEKMRMLEQAIKADSVVQTVQKYKSWGNTSNQPFIDPMSQMQRNRSILSKENQKSNTDTAVQDRINQLKEMVGGVVATNPSASGLYASLDGMSQNTGNGYSQFDGGSDRWRNTSSIRPPNTFQISAGFVIPGLMVSGINSDLPGQIMAQVGENVYDTATGNNLLIPQGSKLVGTYSNEISYGQSRVLVAWQRVIFPDGKTLDLGSMPGADSAGYSGYKDRVNNHFFRVFGSALLMSGIVAGVNLSQDNDSSGSMSDRQRANDALSEALGQQLGQAMSQMIMKNLNIAPTLEIRPGYRFNVIVTKDLAFNSSYKAFDY